MNRETRRRRRRSPSPPAPRLAVSSASAQFVRPHGGGGGGGGDAFRAARLRRRIDDALRCARVSAASTGARVFASRRFGRIARSVTLSAAALRLRGIRRSITRASGGPYRRRRRGSPARPIGVGANWRYHHGWQGWRDYHRGWGGWAGPVFWPYAYDDLFDYAFWPTDPTTTSSGPTATTICSPAFCCLTRCSAAAAATAASLRAGRPAARAGAADRRAARRAARPRQPQPANCASRPNRSPAARRSTRSPRRSIRPRTRTPSSTR